MEKAEVLMKTRKLQNIHLSAETHQRYNHLYHIIAQNANILLSLSTNSQTEAVYIKVYQFKEH